MIPARWRTFASTTALVVAFLAGFLLRPAIGSVIINADGTWWKSLSDDERPIVAVGMVDSYLNGFNVGQSAGYEYGIEAAATHVDRKTEERLISFTAKTKESAIESIMVPSFPKSFGTYVDEITDFYNDNPTVKNKVTVGQVLGCESGYILAGTCDELAKDNQ